MHFQLSIVTDNFESERFGNINYLIYIFLSVSVVDECDHLYIRDQYEGMSIMEERAFYISFFFSAALKAGKSQKLSRKLKSFEPRHRKIGLNVFVNSQGSGKTNAKSG